MKNNKTDIYRFLSFEKLKRIVNNAYDEIFVYDDNYTVIYVNKACERHYGLKQEDIIGKDFFELCDDKYWYPSVLPNVYAEKRSMTIEQTSIMGEKLITTAVPLFSDEDEIEFVVMSVYDTSSNLSNQRLELEEKYKSKKTYSNKENSDKFVFASEQMHELMKYIRRIVNVDSTILISGESGTGKSAIAKYIHNKSNRKEKSFLTINCAAIPEELLESELFGYEKGSFTGANTYGKIGLLELADGGTLFLDEIGELSHKLQAKILHVIQEREFIPIGGRKSKKVDIRIIAATNKDLYELVNKKAFREDLFWRLNVIDLLVPPLRERISDISLFIEYFTDKINTKYNFKKEFSKEFKEMSLNYKWPGNIRQLENFIERLIVTSEGNIIDKFDLPEGFINGQKSGTIVKKEETLNFESYDMAVYNYEKNLIQKAFKEYPSTRKLAEALKITQSKAARLIRKYVSEQKNE